MKKNTIFLIVVLVSFGSRAQVKSGAVKINPLGALVGFLDVSYEKAFSDKNSGQLGVGIISSDFGSTSLSGFGIRPEYRFYSREAIRGFYMAPVGDFSTYTAKITGIVESKVTAFGLEVKLDGIGCLENRIALLWT